MTSNPLERAVIEAARLHCAAIDEGSGKSYQQELRAAVKALNAHHAGQDPEVMEIGWHELAEGDLLKSVKNGKFYEVMSVLKMRGKLRRVTILAGDTPVTVERPTAAEPTAWVKRGSTGRVVDVFTNILFSG